MKLQCTFCFSFFSSTWSPCCGLFPPSTRNLKLSPLLMVGRRTLSLFRSWPSLFPSISFPAPQPANTSSEEPLGCSEEESVPREVKGQSSDSGEPSPAEPPPSAPGPRNTNQTAKLFTPSKLNFWVRTCQSSWVSFNVLPKFDNVVFMDWNFLIPDVRTSLTSSNYNTKPLFSIFLLIQFKIHPNQTFFFYEGG